MNFVFRGSMLKRQSLSKSALLSITLHHAEVILDPISTTLASAAALMANTACGELAKKTVGELWDGLKGAVQRRFGADHAAPGLLDLVRATNGQGPGAEQALGKLATYRLNDDLDIQDFAQRLKTAVAQAITYQTNTVKAETINGLVQSNHGTVSFTFGEKK